MTIYGAYSETDEPFVSLEEAIETLVQLPWMEGRSVNAISMVEMQDPDGVHGRVVTGTASPGAAGAIVYVVNVRHEVLGAGIDIQYLIEFGGVKHGEDAGHEDDTDAGPGHEEGYPELDEGVGQPGESADEEITPSPEESDSAE